MEKTDFRQQQITRLTQLSDAERSQQDLSLQQQLFASPAWQQAAVIATTISSGIEVATQPIIQQAWAEHKQVVIPQTLPKRQMAFKPYTAETDLTRTSFGIFEPTTGETVAKTEIDLILVPGLGYSQAELARIGFGGGYYDRYLADYTGVKLTLAFREMAFAHAEWPVDAYDVVLDQLLVAKDGVDDEH